MAIVVRFVVTGMDADKYSSVMRHLEAAGLAHPDGRLYHACYGDRSNLQVIDVYEAPANLEALGASLMPILHSLGISARPEVLGETQNIVVGPPHK